MDCLESIVQIVSGIFVVLAGIVAVSQYILAKGHERYYYEKERVHLAIDVADYYKEHILEPARRLKQILGEMGLLEIIENIEIDKIEYFDIYENEKKFSKEQSKKIKKIRQEYGINNCVNSYSISYRTIEVDLKTEVNGGDSSEEKRRKIGEEYVELFYRVLNNLEIFSMFFVHEAADETVVYQPLHMSYLEIVRMLYFDISYLNRSGENKLYINTIALFNLWKVISKERKGKEVDSMRKLIKKGKILNMLGHIDENS